MAQPAQHNQSVRPGVSMEKERSLITERILNLTLEVIQLLTGESYIAFKISDGLVPPNVSDIQIPTTDPEPSFLIPERRSNKKVQEVTREIIELLTGEAPIRCQDVAVYLSMEEREYLDGHDDLYKTAMMEEQPPLTPPDGSRKKNPPERCQRPFYSRDSAQEELRTTQDNQIQTPLKVEVKEEAEEAYVRGAEGRVKEEPSPEVSTEAQHYPNNMEEPPIPSPDDALDDDDDLATDSPGENSMTSNLHPVSHSSDLLSGPSTHEGYFADPSHFSAHHAVPSTGETVPCPECGGTFIQRAGVNINTGETLYSCSECGRCFTPKPRLTEHTRTNAGGKPYCCPQCGKGFPSNAHLVIHYRLHTGEKPFSCSECGKRFHQKSNLSNHQRIHSGEKPFSCLECGKRFLRKADLVTHQKTHTGVKPYACPQCGKCYRSKSNVVKHQRIHMV